MSVPQSIKDTLLWKKAIELVEGVEVFTDNIPCKELDVYNINNKLRNSVSEIPVYIEESYLQPTKTGRGKTIFMTDFTLNECKDYLSQAKRLKLGETDDLVERVEQLRLLLQGEQVIGYQQPA